MLTLEFVDEDKEPIQLEYHGNMPLWQYLRDVIAPKAGFTVNASGTVEMCIVHKGRCFDFKNKFVCLVDFVHDGATLSCCSASVASPGTLEGNACSNGGNAEGCPICLEETFDFSLSCLHRFHSMCLLGCIACNDQETRQILQCPTCRVRFSNNDKERLIRTFFREVLQTMGQRA